MSQASSTILKMPLDVQEVVKKQIVYVDVTGKCKDCKHFTEIGPSDAWETVCSLHLSTMGMMNVDPEGRCSHHRQSDPPPSPKKVQPPTCGK